MTRFVLGVAALLSAGGFAFAGPADLFDERGLRTVSPKGTVLVHYFRFTNTTKNTITLGQPRVSSTGRMTCPRLSAKNQLAPGETAAVIAYMDTRRIPQAGVTKTVIVYVPFQSPTFEEVALKVTTVTGASAPAMSPDTLALGTVTKGKGGKVTTKVTFTSDANWEIKKASSTGAYVIPEFKLASRSGTMVTYGVTATLDKDCPAGNWMSRYLPGDVQRGGREAPHPGDGERNRPAGRGAGRCVLRQREDGERLRADRDHPGDRAVQDPGREGRGRPADGEGSMRAIAAQAVRHRRHRGQPEGDRGLHPDRGDRDRQCSDQPSIIVPVTAKVVEK